ncbi:PREDICTED: uncharacterized protein LOC109127405 [Camelina sativa]|uniref:Uncharacterized protein LOC109127405 n=1 Tax=Camelina sativa TaxID=90675 RepID=A0ABM1QLF1_CAMSA|nr:PREDICTED: uncharacterized protein LOC109127405 [Camelina sativa]
MTDLGRLHYFLGISVTRTATGLLLQQQNYAADILHRANMTYCNRCSTPVDTKSKLTPMICLFMHDPREPHFQALKRILRYIKGTISHGFQIIKSSISQLTAYTDADWAGCPSTRRSTSGYGIFLGDSLVSWSSKRQVTVSRSSVEAEYRGVANVVSEATWLRNLLFEMKCPLPKAMIVYCDNISVVYLSSNPAKHQRIKHIKIDLHFVRERVALRQIRVLHVPTSFQYADIFTKGLQTSLFNNFRSNLNIYKPPDSTVGAC